MSKNPPCARFEWMIGPLVDGELPPAEAEAAQKHLDGCPECLRLAEDFRSFDRLSQRLDAPPPISTIEWARLLDGVRRQPQVIHLGSRRQLMDWMVPALSLAALLILAASITIALLNQPEPTRLDAASIRILKESDNPEIKTENTPDAVIIKDSANL